MPDHLQPAQPPQSACQEALGRFAEQHFEHWAGLPTDCSSAEVLARFGQLNDGVGRGMLGSEVAQFMMVLVPAYPEPVRVWYRAEHIVLLDTAYPDFLAGTVVALGEPAVRLDYYWKRLLIPNGQWVYPSRGLALYI